MSDEKKTRKCWSCRKEIEDKGVLFCEECDKKDDKGKSSVGTLVIYDKI